jgi:hypothetical protein
MIFMKTQSNFYLFLIALISAMGGKEYAVTELAAIEAASACQTQE